MSEELENTRKNLQNEIINYYSQLAIFKQLLARKINQIEINQEATLIKTMMQLSDIQIELKIMQSYAQCICSLSEHLADE